MNRSILFRVTAPALLTGLLLVSVCVGSAWLIQRLQANLARILTENLVSVEASADLETRTRQLRYHSFLYLMQPTRDGLLQIEEDEQAFQDAFHRAQQAGNTPKENAYLSKIEEGYREYRAEMARLREEVALNGPQTDFLRLAQRHPIRHITTPCHELERINRQQLEQTVEDSTRTSQQARAVLLLLGVGGPLGGLLCGYGLVRGLNRTIGRLQLRVRDVVDRLGRGVPDEKPGLEEINLGAVTVDLRSPAVGGDLGALDRQLQHILERVEEVMVRLQHQNREIRRAEQLAALGQLAAGVAHEVRNPLTGMKMLVESALPTRLAPVVGTRRGKKQTLTEEDLHVILGEITRLEQTVQHFLDFARPPALQRRTVDLRAVVTRTTDLMRGRARQQGVELRLRLGERPVLVALDSGQFGTVLVNLLVNALDAQPHGGEVAFDLEVLSGKVAAESGDSEGAHPEEGQEGVCCLRIQDRGPGLAAEVVGQLFTPFVSTRPTGTGLGLALSHSVIREHGGSIRAANNLPAEGGGACFVITLPLSPQADGAVGALPDRE